MISNSKEPDIKELYFRLPGYFSARYRKLFLPYLTSVFQENLHKNNI